MMPSIGMGTRRSGHYVMKSMGVPLQLVVSLATLVRIGIAGWLCAAGRFWFDYSNDQEFILNAAALASVLGLEPRWQKVVLRGMQGELVVGGWASRIQRPRQELCPQPFSSADRDRRQDDRCEFVHVRQHRFCG